MAGNCIHIVLWVMLVTFLSGVLARPMPDPGPGPGPGPDSAGIVPRVNGLAYGGIPYGSVTGMVKEYFDRQGGFAAQPIGGSFYDLGNELLG